MVYILVTKIYTVNLCFWPRVLRVVPIKEKNLKSLSEHTIKTFSVTLSKVNKMLLAVID